jgi:hypothetical protein
MPTLPTADDLGVRIPQNRGNVVTGNFDYSGTQQLGSVVENFAAGVKNRQDQINYQKAKTYWQKAKLEADNAFDQDGDFGTYLTRYDDMLGKAKEKATGMVTNRRMREEFEMDVDLSLASGLEGMKDYAFKKESEFGVAHLNDTITAGRENYLRATTPADKQFALESIMESIDFAQGAGYIGADDAQAHRQSVAVDLAIASVEIEAPQKQVEMLKENKGLIDVIPKDTREKMIDSASAQLVNQQGLEIADSIRVAGGALAERTAEVNKIKDVNVRDAARRQVEHDYSIEKTARLESESANYDAARKALNKGQSIGQWMQENPKSWDGMNGEQQASLLSKGSNVTTDRGAYAAIIDLSAKDANEARNFLHENSHLFSESDFQTWEDRLSKTKELDSFASTNEQVLIKFSQAGFNVAETNFKKKEHYLKAIESIDSDIKKFQEVHGKDPSPDEERKIIDSNFEKIEDRFFGKDVYSYSLTTEQRQDRDTKRKADKFSTLLNEYKRQLEGDAGVPVTLSEDEISAIYRNADAMGMLDE